MSEVYAPPARALPRALLALPILLVLLASLLTVQPLKPQSGGLSGAQSAAQSGVSALASLAQHMRGAQAPDAAPASPLAQWPAPPFVLHAASQAEADRAVSCLTDAIYYEAGDQSVEGQRAVAQVVLNRVRDPNFPKSVCGVVYEGWRRKTGCQFSFACDGSIHRRPANLALWKRMRPLAQQALDGHVVPEVGAATHYYATYVTPYWLNSVASVAQIGQHVFCAWKGRAGLPSALTAPYRGGELKVTDEAMASAATRVITVHGRHRVETVIRLAADSHRTARA